MALNPNAQGFTSPVTSGAEQVSTQSQTTATTTNAQPVSTRTKKMASFGGSSVNIYQEYLNFNRFLEYEDKQGRDFLTEQTDSDGNTQLFKFTDRFVGVYEQVFDRVTSVPITAHNHTYQELRTARNNIDILFNTYSDSATGKFIPAPDHILSNALIDQLHAGPLPKKADLYNSSATYSLKHALLEKYFGSKEEYRKMSDAEVANRFHAMNEALNGMAKVNDLIYGKMIYQKNYNKFVNFMTKDIFGKVRNAVVKTARVVKKAAKTAVKAIGRFFTAHIVNHEISKKAMDAAYLRLAAAFDKLEKNKEAQNKQNPTNPQVKPSLDEGMEEGKLPKPIEYEYKDMGLAVDPKDYAEKFTSYMYDEHVPEISMQELEDPSKLNVNKEYPSCTYMDDTPKGNGKFSKPGFRYVGYVATGTTDDAKPKVKVVKIYESVNNPGEFLYGNEHISPKIDYFTTHKVRQQIKEGNDQNYGEITLESNTHKQIPFRYRIKGDSVNGKPNISFVSSELAMDARQGVVTRKEQPTMQTGFESFDYSNFGINNDMPNADSMIYSATMPEAYQYEGFSNVTGVMPEVQPGMEETGFTYGLGEYALDEQVFGANIKPNVQVEEVVVQPETILKPTTPVETATTVETVTPVETAVAGENIVKPSTTEQIVETVETTSQQTMSDAERVMVSVTPKVITVDGATFNPPKDAAIRTAYQKNPQDSYGLLKYSYYEDPKNAGTFIVKYDENLYAPAYETIWENAKGTGIKLHSEQANKDFEFDGAMNSFILSQQKPIKPNIIIAGDQFKPTTNALIKTAYQKNPEDEYGLLIYSYYEDPANPGTFVISSPENAFAPEYETIWKKAEKNGITLHSDQTNQDFKFLGSFDLFISPEENLEKPINLDNTTEQTPKPEPQQLPYGIEEMAGNCMWQDILSTVGQLKRKDGKPYIGTTTLEILQIAASDGSKTITAKLESKMKEIMLVSYKNLYLRELFEQKGITALPEGKEGEEILNEASKLAEQDFESLGWDSLKPRGKARLALYELAQGKFNPNAGIMEDDTLLDDYRKDSFFYKALVKTGMVFDLDAYQKEIKKELEKQIMTEDILSNPDNMNTDDNNIDPRKFTEVDVLGPGGTIIKAHRITINGKEVYMSQNHTEVLEISNITVVPDTVSGKKFGELSVESINSNVRQNTLGPTNKEEIKSRARGDETVTYDHGEM